MKTQFRMKHSLDLQDFASMEDIALHVSWWRLT